MRTEATFYEKKVKIFYDFFSYFSTALDFLNIQMYNLGKLQ